MAYLHAVAAARAQHAYRDWQAVQARDEAIGGIPWRLLGTMASDGNAPIDLTAIGAALALARRIAGLGLYVRRGEAVLPDTLLQEFGASPNTLYGADPALFRTAVAYAGARLERALAERPATFRRRYPFAGVAIALERALLREIERDGCRLLDRRIYLTPLQRAWVSWRAVRHERRQR